jgi:hypothetical protein
MPLFSGKMFRLPLKFESDSSGGFKRRTSSRSNCRIRDPREPSQPFGDNDFEVDTATPTEDRPYSSIDVTPTIVIHSRSLSSRPSSEAREYIIDDIGSEYDAPRE